VGSEGTVVNGGAGVWTDDACSMERLDSELPDGQAGTCKAHVVKYAYLRPRVRINGAVSMPQLSRLIYLCLVHFIECDSHGKTSIARD
jgi:hypothetical protein